MRGEGLKLDQPRVEKSDVPWQAMETSPKDGLPCWLKSEEGKIIEAYWRRTRQYRKGMWNDVYYWSVYGQNPQIIPFTPSFWTRGKSSAD